MSKPDMKDDMTEWTDDMLRAAIRAMKKQHERFVGFSTSRDGTWGPPYYVRDFKREKVIWRGDSHNEMMEQCEMARLRIGIEAALTGRDAVPHEYAPSAMHMGDCDICGNLRDHPIHRGGY
jgi:hypothetical protein